MELTVRELTVSVIGKDKELLRDVSFRAAPSELVALMGPSGAGKTTLLNQLVDQGTKGLKTTGKIRFGAGALPQEDGQLSDIRTKVGYVTQDDIMYECMTPRENLTYAARFLQARATATERAASVDAVLEKLNLTKCADTVVGSPGLIKGVSGGERKRTNVAMSLLGQPSLLLLDEPTSGLDAKMAYGLMSDLSSVAEQGCTIIATIHQPSDACFQRFTKVLLLSAGKVAYFGPVQGLADRLSALGFQMPERVPLPEVLLNILEVNDGGETQAAKMKGLLDASDPMPAVRESTGGNSGKAGKQAQRLGICGQLGVLLRRNLLHLRRTKALTVVRAAQTIMSTVLISLIFVRLPGDLTGVRSRFFAAFMLGIAQMMFALIGVVNTFPDERAVFLRETQDRWYHPLSYYFAKVLLDCMMQSFFPLLTTGIGYFLVGLNDGSVERVVLFYVIVSMMCNAGAALGFIISASVSSISQGLSIAPGFIMPQFLLAGVFLPVSVLPQPFKALSFLSLARYGLQALVFNEFACDIHPECGAAQRMLHGSACESSKCNFCCSDTDVLTTGGVCPVVTCDDALTFLKMEIVDAWPTGSTAREAMLWNLLALFVVTILFRFLGLVALLVAYRRAVK